MAKPRKTEKRYVPPYTLGPDVDLERDDIRDNNGNRITEKYVDRAVERLHREVGRPSLTAPGRRSPSIAVRVPDSIRSKMESRARTEGKSLSQLARDAIEAYLAAS